jgi:uncharacterized protein (DUF3820 family)
MPEPQTQNPEDMVMPFGKHSGQTLGDILAKNASYLDWLNDGHCGQGVLAEAVKAMCEKYAPEIEVDITVIRNKEPS